MKRILLALLATVCCAAQAQTADPLPSWNDGAAKRNIVEFVKAVTTKGGKQFVPVSERIATFDNDGTLWAEQPMYFQFLFAIDRVKALAPQHPEWKEKEPYASLLKGDVKAVLAGREQALLEIVDATHSGMTTEAFEKIVQEWFATARHPRFKQRYDRMIYQPMLWLQREYRAQGGR